MSFFPYFLIFTCLIFSAYADQGRVIVIGASSGIGEAVVRAYAKQGYRIGGIARREDRLISIKNDLGEAFLFKVADVTQPVSRDLVSELINELGGCDIFILNAGIWADSRKEFVAGDREQLLADQLSTINTNVTGFVSVASVALDYFITQGKGHFVGISSVDAVRGHPNCPVYSASKAFVSNYMQGTRAAFQHANLPISVTDIRPGYISTYEDPNFFWVASPEQAAADILLAIQEKKDVAYVTWRWGLFALYLALAPQAVYNYVSTTYGIR